MFTTVQARAEPEFLVDGSAGFVVSSIRYALAGDAEENGACPGGMTTGYVDKSQVFVARDGLQLRDGETEAEHLKRLFGVAFGADPVRNLCMNPELGGADAGFRVVTGENVPVFGIDMDGAVSAIDGQASQDACPHDDFAGMNGESGIDNQYYRVMGCSAQYQSTGLSNSFEIEMLTGSWGVLITLDGVDDIVNDDEVQVGIFASADPIALSSSREPLPYATYAMHQDPRFQARTRGRISGGVLTTDPVDVRIEWVVNSIRLDRPLDDARLHLVLDEEGVLDGYLAGYTNVEDLYNYNYSFRSGTDGTGNLAPLRLRAGSAIGKAFVLGYTCEGIYQALYEYADADPDPDTGRCRAISTQYQISALPAFVVDEATASSNAILDAAGFGRADVYDAKPANKTEGP
ncbi:MAG: hypothetical protein HKN19_03265 [Halioglobus sp.]|nr:hypothetical protein [Halioglobus sp.]